MPRQIVASLLALVALAGCQAKGPRPESGATNTERRGTLTNADWVTVPSVTDPVFQGLTIPADAPTKGMWSATQSWPMNALHATLLPNGTVLTFGTNLDGSQQNGRYYDVWSPLQGFGTGSHATSYDASREDSFCATSTFLTDGRLMVSGGNGGVSSQFYTPGTGQLSTATARLALNRWYATLVTLPDGRPLMLGGMVPYSEAMQDDPEGAIAQGTPSMTPEIMDTTTWRSLFGAYSRDAFGPDYLRCSYPRAFVAPNGKVFGISSEKMWYLDPTNNGSIQTVGNFKQGYTSANPVNVGATNTAVMYTTGKILVAGGNGGFNGDGLPASNMATVVDINSGGAVLTELPVMNFPRRYPNGIALPEGKVLITGGTRKGNNNGTDAVYAAEIWNPTTNTWTVGANAAQYRGYHSFSILLPSGVVLSTGGGTPGPVTNLNAEVYYPPSLFKTVSGAAQLAPRPVIVGISGLTYLNGGDLQLDLSDSAPISGLVMLGTSNGTHSFNTGQRRIPLTFTQQNIRLTTTIPANTLAPPGYYQVIAVDANGVPSRGVIIAVGQGVAPPPVSTTPYNPPDLSVPIAAPIIPANGTASYSVTSAANVTYSWNFGDGSSDTPWSGTASATHTFGAPGVYTVTLTAKAADGSTSRRTLLQGVATAKTAAAPTQSTAMAIETRTSGASARLWVANPDNDTVGVVDLATNNRVATIAVGGSPRTVALAPNGQVWVVNRGSASISVVDPGTLAVARTVALPRASAPFGLAFAPDRSAAYLTLEATGTLAKLDPSSGAVVQSLALGSTGGRHVSVAADGTILVTRFITPPLPGESTATVNTAVGGGEVLVVNAGTFTITNTIVLQQSTKTDTTIQGSGVPNYLGAAIVSPDGTNAWVPSKQDNVGRGMLRNALPLDFQNTLRAITSRINLGARTEDYARRVDHDNSGVATAAVFHPSGVYLFVALETSRQVALVDAIRGAELLRFDAGRAPQGLAVSADGNTLYVQNFMDRTVSVIDLTPLVARGELRVAAAATTTTIATEALSATVLLGKQLFCDARDPRLAKDAYISCASCHADAGQDGRVWDLTGFGEGLRNTIALAGRAGMGQGFVHWSANFDEIQDFEKQIRNLSSGTGLMTDAQFNTGTRNQPLGDKKAGVSSDLDALAAYLGSLGRFASSPYRNADSTLTAAASAGKAVFASAACGTCHGGAPFTISATAAEMKNVGTIQPSSGSRLGAALTGIDVPTLRDVWATAPYLHNGSAATLSAAIQAHTGVNLNATDLANVAAYVQQIGGDELGALGIWRFDEGSGTTAADSSSSNRTITLANTTWVGGKVGRAIQLNGTNAAGSTAGPVVDTTGSFTVAAWVRLDSLTGWRTAVNQDGANVSGFWLQFGQSLGSKFSFTMHDSDSTSSTPTRALSTTTPIVGQWYHLAAVRDRGAGTMKLYVNGTLEGTTAYTGGWAASGPLNVGRGKWTTPNDWFAGAIDDVQAFSGVLTDTDIGQLALQGRAPSQGAWKFDEGTGTTVADASGAFHPLTLANTTWIDARLGKGAQFNGTTSVGTTTAPVVDTSGTFSIAAWVRCDSLTGTQTMVNQDGVNVSGFWLQYAQSLGNKFAFAMQASDSTTATLFRATSTTTPVSGQWYHLVAVRDKGAGTIKLYVNGALEATTATTGSWTAGGALNVGRGKSGSANDWFAGALDDVQIVPNALAAGDVSTLYAQGRAPLRGLWKLDEGTGTQANDGSGAGRNLTATNTTWVNGKIGKALQFNGTNAAASASGAVLDTTGSFSAAAWVRLDSLTGWRTAVNQDGTSVSGFWLQYSQSLGNKFSFTMHDSDSTSSTPTRAVSTTTPTTGVWYHLVGVRDKLAGTMKLYVNGRLEATTAYTGGWAASGALNVGRGKFTSPNDWFGGAIDEVQVFAGPLSDTNVTNLFNTGSP